MYINIKHNSTRASNYTNISYNNSKMKIPKVHFFKFTFYNYNSSKQITKTNPQLENVLDILFKIQKLEIIVSQFLSNMMLELFISPCTTFCCDNKGL